MHLARAPGHEAVVTVVQVVRRAGLEDQFRGRPVDQVLALQPPDPAAGPPHALGLAGPNRGEPVVEVGVPGFARGVAVAAPEHVLLIKFVVGQHLAVGRPLRDDRVRGMAGPVEPVARHRQTQAHSTSADAVDVDLLEPAAVVRLGRVQHDRRKQGGLIVGIGRHDDRVRVRGRRWRGAPAAASPT